MGGNNSAAQGDPGMAPDQIPLALRQPQAAQLLGISTKTLQRMTQTHNVPHIRLGRALLYPVEGLRRWLDEQSASNPVAEDNDGGAP
jgi:excisionase family DNA binding protein